MLRSYPEWEDVGDQDGCPTGRVSCRFCEGIGYIPARGWWREENAGEKPVHKEGCPRAAFEAKYKDGKPKLVILDRDGVLNVNSKEPESPYYYILEQRHMILKPNVLEAIAILKQLGIPVVLATRQKCISKGLITLEDAKELNWHLCELLQYTFDHMYVQPAGDHKKETFVEILDDYQCDPSDVVLFDDSAQECHVAFELGIRAIRTECLLTSVKEVFKDKEPLLLSLEVFVPGLSDMPVG